MHIRLVIVYLLSVPSASSLYFNKIKGTSHLGKWHALWLEILFLLIFQDDFADNREFIALLVYDTGGKKVFYPCMYNIYHSIQ